MMVCNGEISDLATSLGMGARNLADLAEKYVAACGLCWWETRLLENLRALAEPKPEPKQADDD